MKAIETTVKHCTKCNCPTLQIRSVNKTSAIMILIHIVLVLMTAGLWILLLIVWKILNAKIGGWACTQCNPTLGGRL